MLSIPCPHCGELREESEFHCFGQAHLARPVDPDACTDEEWGNYLYFRKNTRGVYTELWVHAVGCRKFFNLMRDTQSYRIIGSYLLGGDAPADSRGVAR
ncbi:MAG TPA: sarcosine oxidase subunit delta [Haliea salexigens]|uniref:Sarcosine oxidase subunit delta n=1 Tax=Haliea salexigens TaxID=287487 RepID=A0A3C1KJ64_9GAMM|nr:sarcosine oxidase subunit delta [Haliea sp.]HAN26424.1 sarcosine oxidase subunit delta [Haliea salexigens]|tara:strand:+ start:1305 stop:1601 length:297 start_codon:yes stop_codon:yes gene_type:complete